MRRVSLANRCTSLVVGNIFLLAGCSSALPRSGGYYQDDGPHHKVQANLGSIPDAVPRHEPLSRGGNSPYTVFGKKYYPLQAANNYQERGIASWYGKKFHGNRTSNGEIYDMYTMTAAHKTLPLPSYVRVKNLRNGRSVVVRVNDRGPFLNNRLIDLSYAAAHRLDIIGTGTGLVEVTAATSDTPIEPLQKVTSSPPETPPKLYLQVGAFTRRENAESLRVRLQQADFKPVNILHTRQETSALYRVRIGPLAGVEDTDALARQVTNYGIHNSYVVVE